MGIENFIRDALHKPIDYISYHVGRELAELHPGKTILEGEIWDFDLEARSPEPSRRTWRKSSSAPA